jgi:alpha-L-rhamnosidase
MKNAFICFILVISGLNLSAQTVTNPAIVASEMIYEKAPFKECHASTIAATPLGLIAAWFGGTKEKNKDVEIWISRKQNGKWTDPRSVANGIQHKDKRYPCWNPVLFQVPDGPLLLFYKVGPNPSEWWGMLMTSKDGGDTWSEPTRLPEDIIGPVKNKPELLLDGRLICPSSTEHDGWTVHFEITTDLGKTWERVGPINDGKKYNIIQPSILKHKNGKLQVMCRSKEGNVISSWSEDGGYTWSKPEPSALPNPNSGTDAVTLQNGWHLIVYNHTGKPAGKWGGKRTPLNVAVSEDGYNWKQVVLLEDEPGEYSYPAVIQSPDGMIHITYTWKRDKVKYVMIDPKKLKFN